MRHSQATLRGDHVPWEEPPPPHDRERPISDVEALQAAVQARGALLRAGAGLLVPRTPPTPMAVFEASTTPEPAASLEAGGRGITGDVTALVYELLDAHADTADLAAELVDDPRWADHLDYLRALQRAGREALVRYSAEGQEPAA